MADFTDIMRRRGKAEEDLYFAELDRQRVRALHDKEIAERHAEYVQDCQHTNSSSFPDDNGSD